MLPAQRGEAATKVEKLDNRRGTEFAEIKRILNQNVFTPRPLRLRSE